MATPFPNTHQDLIDVPYVGALSTIGTDGAPQVTALWYLATDDVVRMSLLTSRQKYRNLVARPQATLFVIDPTNSFRTLEVRGTAVVEDDPDLVFFDRIVRHYGHDPADFPANRDGRCVLTLTPTRVVALG